MPRTLSDAKMKVVGNTPELVAINLDIINSKTTSEELDAVDARYFICEGVVPKTMRVTKDGFELVAVTPTGKRVTKDFHFADLLLMSDTLHKIIGPHFGETNKSKLITTVVNKKVKKETSTPAQSSSS